MKHHSRRLLNRAVFVLFWGLLLPALIVHAQSRLSDDPGFVDLGAVEQWFEDAPTLEVDIRGRLLHLVAEASRLDDPELSVLLGKLKAIQVRGYSLRHSQFDDIARHASAFARRLSEDGWHTVLHVRERGEQTDMYVRMNHDEIAGMMVMVIEPGYDDTVFLNIVGNIDPEQIGRLGRKFDLGHLDDF